MNRSCRNGLDIALQGGGAHGAFTWGVLDRLLEDEDIGITAVSGASAGAVNAAVLASGLANGGREGARRALSDFWEALNRVSRDSGPLIPLMEAFPLTFQALSNWWSTMFGNVSLPSSPEMGAASQQALRSLLEEHIDFHALRHGEAPRLFLSATDVRNGNARIFRNEEMSADVLLASACLPLFFPPVTIDGVDYWDGGYSANPPIMPLVQESPCATCSCSCMARGARPPRPGSMVTGACWGRRGPRALPSAMDRSRSCETRCCSASFRADGYRADCDGRDEGGIGGQFG